MVKWDYASGHRNLKRVNISLSTVDLKELMDSSFTNGVCWPGIDGV